MRTATAYPIRCVLLTTRNRPELLHRSLPQVLEQSHSLGLPLVIADDGSTDSDTLRMISDAQDDGAIVWLSEETDTLPGVFSTGRRFVSAVCGLIDEFHTGAFIKVDDDVLLAGDCLESLVNAWASVSTTTPSLSAMLDMHTEPRRVGPSPGLVVTDWSSSVCCVHRLDLWAEALMAMGDQHFVRHGWDVGFFWHWLDRRKHGHPLTLVPSRAYHAGHIGTRTTHDLNRRPPDPYAMSWPGGTAEGGTTHAPTP